MRARHPRNNKARIISPLIRPDAMPVRSACATTFIRVCATATYVCVNRARRLTRRARRYLLTCYVFVRRALPRTRYKRGGRGEGGGCREEGRHLVRVGVHSCYSRLWIYSWVVNMAPGELPPLSTLSSFLLRHSPSVRPFSASPFLLIHPLYRNRIDPSFDQQLN